MILLVLLLLFAPSSAWAFTHIQGTATATSTVTAPSGLQTGDYMIAAFGEANGDTITGPAGWTHICTLGAATYTQQSALNTRTDGGDKRQGELYGKFATGADVGGTTTYTVTGSTYHFSGIDAWRGVEQSDMQPIDMKNCYIVGTTGTTLNAPDMVSLAFSGDVVISGWIYAFGGVASTFTPPGGLTAAWASNTSGHLWMGYNTAPTYNYHSIEATSGSQNVNDSYSTFSITLKAANPATNAIFKGTTGGTTYYYDGYGGDVVDAGCPAGASLHFYTAKITRNGRTRWWLCDPLGDLWAPRGVFFDNWTLTPNQAGGYAAVKYAGGPITPHAGSSLPKAYFNWAIFEFQRLMTYGIDFQSNGAQLMSAPDPGWANYTLDTSSPLQIPMQTNNLGTHYAMEAKNGCSTPLKSLINAARESAGGFFPYYYGSGYADYFDSGYAACVAGMDATVSAQALGQPSAGGTPHPDMVVAFDPDDTDQTTFIDAGTDFTLLDPFNTQATGGPSDAHLGWVELAAGPRQDVSYKGILGPLNFGVLYSDHETYGKVAAINLLANRYVCTGNGTSLNGALACCTGSGTGTCSADPHNGSYIGSANNTSGIAALNSAWTTSFGGHTATANYTTFWTSDATNCGASVGEACLQNGTYEGWNQRSQTVTCSGSPRLCSATLSPAPVQGPGQPFASSPGYTLVTSGTGSSSIWIGGDCPNNSGGACTSGNFISENSGMAGSPTSTINYGTGAVSFYPTDQTTTAVTMWYVSSTTIGTGLLDENGICGNSSNGYCWLGDSVDPQNGPQSYALPVGPQGRNLPATNAALADMNAILSAYVDAFGSANRSGLNSTMPGVLLTFEVGNATPARAPVYQELGKYLDYLASNMNPPPLYCSACSGTDLTNRTNFILNNWNDQGPLIFDQTGWYSQRDSAMADTTTNGIGTVTTQNQRGSLWDTQFTSSLGLQSGNGDYQMAGMQWFALWDATGGNVNWGLLSILDNAYDGVEAVSATGTDANGFAIGNEAQSVNLAECSGSGTTYLNGARACCTGARTGTCGAPQNIACTAASTPYTWCTGSGTGTGTSNYGDMIDSVKSDLLPIYGTMLGPVVNVGGGNGAKGGAMW